MSDVRKIFEFTTYIEGFKKIQRFTGQHFWKDYPKPERYESDADHTWRMAMILATIESRLSQPFDFKKAMKMLLIHDIPEMISGDPSPLGSDGTGKDSHAYNTEVANAKFASESAAADEIFSKLPDDQTQELLGLWHEFEAQSSFEARVVKAIDKFEGKLQALEYSKGVMFKNHYDFTISYGVETFDADPVLKELGDTLITELKRQYTEFKEKGGV